MRKLPLLFTGLVFGLLTPAVLTAQSRPPGEIPPIIAAGMQAYKDSGPEAAVRAWIKGSPIDGSKEALSQANNLRQVQDFYGNYQGFEVVSREDLGSRSRIVYLVMDFDKGPLFAKFVIYRSELGWILTNFNFNTKDEIFPTPLP